MKMRKEHMVIWASISSNRDGVKQNTGELGGIIIRTDSENWMGGASRTKEGRNQGLRN